MTRRSVFTLVATLALGISAQAFARPNFSGTWKMNPSKSDYGPVPAPEKMERTIKHDDPKLSMVTTQAGPQGEIKTNIAYMTDGTESKNMVQGQEAISVAKWDGDVLTVKSKRQVQGMEITFNERWTLSEDGKVLTIVNQLNTPQGDFEIKIVMDKQ